MPPTELTNQFVAMEETTMDEVLQNLFITDIKGATSEQLKEKNKITHILSCCEVDNFENVKQLKIPVVDVEIENFTKYFEECSKFIKEGLENDGRVLVHCNAGQSRCATAICAYLIIEKKMKVEESINLIKKARPMIEPNRGFMKQLTELSGETIVNPKEKSGYCKKCRTKIFSESDLVAHEPGKNRKNFSHKKMKKDTKSNSLTSEIICNKFFFDRMKWMPGMTELEGLLSCTKCDSKIGGWRWDGEQCSCGVWICPSIHILKKNIDF